MAVTVQDTEAIKLERSRRTLLPAAGVCRGTVVATTLVGIADGEAISLSRQIV